MFCFFGKSYLTEMMELLNAMPLQYTVVTKEITIVTNHCHYVTLPTNIRFHFFGKSYLSIIDGLTETHSHASGIMFDIRSGRVSDPAPGA